MAEPTVLSLTAKADQLLTTLNEVIIKIEDLEELAGQEFELKFTAEDAVANLTKTKELLDNLDIGAKLSEAQIKFFSRSLAEAGAAVKSLSKDFKSLEKDAKVDPLTKEVRELSKELGTLTVALNNSSNAASFEETRANILALTERFKQLGIEVELNGGKIKGLDSEYNRLGNNIRSALSLASREFSKLKETGENSAQSLSNKIGQLEIILLELRAAADKSNQGLLESKSAYTAIANQLNVIAPLISTLGKNMPEVVQRFVTLKNGVNSSLKSVESDLKKISPASDKADTGFAKLAASAQSVANSIRLIVFSRVVTELKQLAEESIKTAAELQALRNSFAAVLADADNVGSGFERADAALAHLREEADTLGITFLPLAENFLTLQAAGQAAGFTMEEVTTIFDSVAVAAAAMNLNTDKLNKTLSAFEQIMSKGILSAEEIRRQLGNSLPGAFSITARALDVTNEQLEQMLRSGTVLSKEALPKIAAEIVKTFGPAAIANVTSARAEFARLENKALDLKNAIGTGLNEVLVDVAHNLNSVELDTARVSAEFAKYAANLRDVVGVFGNLIQLDIGGSLTNLGSFFVRTETNIVALITALEGVQLKLLGFGAAGDAVVNHAKNMHDGIEEVIEEFRIWAGISQSAGQVAEEYNRRAAKSVEELKKKQAELLAQAPKLKDIEEATKGLPAHYQNIAKELQGIADDVKVYTDGQAELNQALDPKFLEAYALRVAELRDRLKEQGALTPQMVAYIEKLEAAMGDAAVAAGRAAFEFKKLGLTQASSLDESAQALFRYIAEVKKTGPATKEQADLIVKSATDILEALNLLPESQKKNFGSLEGILKKVINSYKGFTTEAIKEADKLRQETAKKFEELGKSIEEIFNRVKNKIAGTTEDTTNADKIKALNDELFGLQQKAVQTTEDVKRIDEIFAELATTQQQISVRGEGVKNVLDQMAGSGGLLKSAFTGFGLEVSKEFTEAILSNEKFIEGLASLPSASQAAATSLISNFASIAESGQATQVNLQQLFEGLVAIFADAGVKLQGFNEILKGTGDLASQIQAKIADATATARDQISKASGDLREAANGAASKGFAGVEVDPPINVQTWKQSEEVAAALILRQEQLQNRIASGTLSAQEAEVAQAELDKVMNTLAGTIQESVAPAFVEAAAATNRARLAADPTNKSYQKLVETGLDLSRAWGQMDEKSKNLVNSSEAWNQTLTDGTIEIGENTQRVQENAAAMERNKDAIAGLNERASDFTNHAIEIAARVAAMEKGQDSAAQSTEEFANTVETSGKKMEENFTSMTASASTVEETQKRIITNQIEINRLMSEMGDL